MTLTDEQLAEWERQVESVNLGLDIDRRLIQEVRRLREVEDDLRFEREVNKQLRLSNAWKREDAARERAEAAEAELDRYIEALKEIVRMAEEPHLQIARAAEVAQAALKEQS